MQKSYLIAANTIVPDYFCIESLEDNNRIQSVYSGVKYSLNNGITWNEYIGASVGVTETEIILNTNEKVYFKKKVTQTSFDTYDYLGIPAQFFSSKTVNISGCLSSLFNEKDKIYTAPSDCRYIKLYGTFGNDDKVESLFRTYRYDSTLRTLKIIDASEFKINIRTNYTGSSTAAPQGVYAVHLFEDLPIEKAPKLINEFGRYDSMFENCTALTTAPRLPYTGNCNYSSMFYGCTNLEQIPALPSTASNEYTYMFNGCSKIKISETQTGEYQNAYTVYSTSMSGTWSAGMFNNTGGTFTGGTFPSGTTYYTSNTVIQ